MTLPLTPHGPGFRFIDRFEGTDPKHGTAWKHLNPDALFFADHFPGQPLMPAVFLVECAAQAAGVLWMMESTQPETPLFLASIDQFRILGPVGPDQTIETSISLIKELGSLAQFEAECTVDGSTVARGRIMLSRQLTKPTT